MVMGDESAAGHQAANCPSLSVAVMGSSPGTLTCTRSAVPAVPMTRLAARSVPSAVDMKLLTASSVGCSAGKSNTLAPPNSNPPSAASTMHTPIVAPSLNTATPLPPRRSSAVSGGRSTGTGTAGTADAAWSLRDPSAAAAAAASAIEASMADVQVWRAASASEVVAACGVGDQAKLLPVLPGPGSTTTAAMAAAVARPAAASQPSRERRPPKRVVPGAWSGVMTSSAVAGDSTSMVMIVSFRLSARALCAGWRTTASGQGSVAFSRLKCSSSTVPPRSFRCRCVRPRRRSFALGAVRRVRGGRDAA